MGLFGIKAEGPLMYTDKSQCINMTNYCKTFKVQIYNS